MKKARSSRSLELLKLLRTQAKAKLPDVLFQYLDRGADDDHTVERNITAFQETPLIANRFFKEKKQDQPIELLGETWASPILLAPIGMQAVFHPEGELATAKAANKLEHLMMVSTVSNYSYAEIASLQKKKPWFQLYPTTNRNITKILIQKAEQAGAPVLVLTIDYPIPGNRPFHRLNLLPHLPNNSLRLGNLDGLMGNENVADASMTWEIIPWLRSQTNMKIVLKGIMTQEDALIALDYGVDALIVSNHGGRQLESGFATIDALPEIVKAVEGKIPVLMDGGIRSREDVLKALQLGATAVCLGRAYMYGLVVEGQLGVERVLAVMSR